MISVQVDDTKIRDALTELAKKTENLRPVMLEIGETLTESTKHRFVTTIDPDGKTWERNSITTLLYKEGDTPLTGETGFLMSTIDYQSPSSNSVLIGSPMEYAAMQQFGGTKAEFPHLWGDIPARPFLGLSSDDEKSIIESIEDYITAHL